VSDDRPFTPEATVGPFYPGVFLNNTPQDLWTVAPLVAHRPQGQPVVVAVRFLDALRRPVPSLLVEFWQANAHGRYRHPQDRFAAPLDPQFDGFARLRTGDEGTVRFHTIKPGAHPVRLEREALQLGHPETVEGPARSAERSVAMRAPHLRLTIFASGIDRLATQIFFDDEPLNVTDPLLNSIPDPVVRARLIATYRGVGAEAGTDVGERMRRDYAIDIVLRGDAETPFFDDFA
jgi:protocatechuate 3,4-dioxygenase beta subunit